MPWSTLAKFSSQRRLDKNNKLFTYLRFIQGLYERRIHFYRGICPLYPGYPNDAVPRISTFTVNEIWNFIRAQLIADRVLFERLKGHDPVRCSSWLNIEPANGPFRTSFT